MTEGKEDGSGPDQKDDDQALFEREMADVRPLGPRGGRDRVRWEEVRPPASPRPRTREPVAFVVERRAPEVIAAAAQPQVSPSQAAGVGIGPVKCVRDAHLGAGAERGVS